MNWLKKLMILMQTESLKKTDSNNRIKYIEIYIQNQQEFRLGKVIKKKGDKLNV